MSGISFQALPRLGVSFKYGGQGSGGYFAQERVNWDRSFDAHISLFDEGKYLPAVSLGLRDFIGTGWYSSEYIVGTKSIGRLELTAVLALVASAKKYVFQPTKSFFIAIHKIGTKILMEREGHLAQSIGFREMPLAFMACDTKLEIRLRSLLSIPQILCCLKINT